MEKLLSFLIKNITKSDKFAVKSSEEEGRVDLEVTADKAIIGLIIGKAGKTIKNLRRILSVLGVKNSKSVYITVNEA